MEWITIWKIILIAGISLFVITVVYIIPYGIRDVIDYFKNLKNQE